MDALWTEIIGKFGIPVAASIFVLWAGTGDKPKWVFGNYFRETIEKRDKDHVDEMERRDKEYNASLVKYAEDLVSERKRSDQWQQKYLGVLETAHSAVQQTVSIVAANSAKEDGR